MRKDGTMLPPITDMLSMASVLKLCNWSRLFTTEARNIPKPEQAKAVAIINSSTEAILGHNTRPNTAEEKVNMIISCITANIIEESILPVRISVAFRGE
jgi:hypothetical protein